METLPRVINFVWLGDDKLPIHANKIIRRWKKLYPDYEIKLWMPANYLPLLNQRSYDEAFAIHCFEACSDIARYEIIHRMGGIYLDLDIWPLKQFDFTTVPPNSCLLTYENRFIGGQQIISNAIICANAKDPFLSMIIEEIPKSTMTKHPFYLSGPGLVTRLGKTSASLITVMPAIWWCPFKPGENFLPEIPIPTKESYGIHFFNSSSGFLKKGIPNEWCTQIN